ncbi:putative zinc finger protein [Pseudonocardia cypriaca]|uniref:Putative zinc finger protein n=1 Tax=Pseudonocardia cypriaca TaxID=882449 RepID=A0A543GDQ9_9PSEU|nr:putative zinc finger protein [Pseudonocardia cypriaca]
MGLAGGLRGDTGPVDELACRDLVERVTDYLEGVLGPEETERVNRHLAGCDGCTAYVEQVRASVRASGALPAEVPSAQAEARLLDIFRTWTAERQGR